MSEIKIVIKFRPDDYGGVEAVELHYQNDCIYIRGELDDSYESIEDFIYCNRRLYDTVLECALAMEGDK